MQIRELHYFAGSYKLIGQIINVPMNVVETIKTLPRNLDDDATFTVSLKKHLAHRSATMSGCISKRNIKIWMRYLLTTPLYQNNNVTLNAAFFDNERDAISRDEADDALSGNFERKRRACSKEFVEFTSKRAKRTNAEEFLSLYQETLFWPEDMILNLAPAAGERPLSLAFDEFAEEMSFPEIYYGQPRSFTQKVNPFAVATSEIRRRDRRGVNGYEILYTAAKILRLRCIASLNAMFKTRVFAGASITRADLVDRAFVQSIWTRMSRFCATFQTLCSTGRQRSTICLP